MDREYLVQQAQQLVRHVADGCTSIYQGSWTMSVYDTAWVSMIEKPSGG